MAKKITLSIEGMTCTNCAMSISRAIEKSGGDKADVNFTIGEARFVLQDGSDISDIIKSIDKLGYKATRNKEGEIEKEDNGW